MPSRESLLTTRMGPRAAASTRTTVLIVDDDRSILNALSRLSRSAGFAVQTFERPSSLLAAKVPSGRVCLVADINLPEMNGIELCNEIAARGHDLPIILITGRDANEIQPMLSRISYVAILYKPIDEAPFLGAITRAIGRGSSR